MYALPPRTRSHAHTYALPPRTRTLPAQAPQQLLLLLLLVLLHHGGSHTAAAQPWGAGSIDPAEVEARAQKLLADNLQPLLDYWGRLRAARGGRKLTMQHFFKTVKHTAERRGKHVNSWGVLNGRVVRLDKEGEARYGPDAMMKEGLPNRGAAETMKRSLLLAIEDGIARGMSFPDVMFTYNVAVRLQLPLGSSIDKEWTLSSFSFPASFFLPFLLALMILSVSQSTCTVSKCTDRTAHTHPQDMPMCSAPEHIPCQDGTYAPPLGLMR